MVGILSGGIMVKIMAAAWKQGNASRTLNCACTNAVTHSCVAWYACSLPVRISAAGAGASDLRKVLLFILFSAVLLSCRNIFWDVLAL